MEVKTKFNLGDTLSVIAENKVKDFVVKTILITDNAVSYGEGKWDAYPEDVCFGSRKELCDYILSNSDKEKSETNKTKEL